MFDYLIKDGMLLDGSGKPGFAGDIAIQGGKIAAIGRIDAAATRVISASGLVVTPGFIDIHRHADAAVFRPDFGQLELHQGLTTIVNGNCGLSLAPVSPAHKAEILGYMSPITGRVPSHIETATMDGYLEQVGRQPLPINVGMLVGGGTLRANAAGYETERLEMSHYDKIHSQLEASLTAGALGVSLGLGYAPECFYTTQELIRALSPVRGTGIPITVHMRQEGDGMLAALEEMMQVARALQVPVHISHLKAIGKRNWNDVICRALEILDRARQEGLDVSCDVYPYTAGSTQLLHILPPEFLQGGTEAALGRIATADGRAQLAQRLATGTDFENIVQLAGWENIRMSTLCHPENKPYEGLSVQEAAERLGKDPLDCCCDMLISEGGAITMIDFITCEADIARILQAPFANVISDSTYPTEGIPHPRLYGTFPRVIQKYVQQDKVLTLPQAVQKMTSIPADVLGLTGKGRLAVGADADLNVFDACKLQENGTYQAPAQFASGLEAVFVGGELVLRHDELTGATPGNVLLR